VLHKPSDNRPVRPFFYVVRRDCCACADSRADAELADDPVDQCHADAPRFVVDGVGKKSFGVRLMPSASAASRTDCLCRSGIDPESTQPCTVVGGFFMALARGRTPPKQLMILMT